MPLAGKRVRLEEEEQGSGMTNARSPQGHLEWCGLCDDEVRIRSPLVQTIFALLGRGMRIATPVCALVRNDRLDGLVTPNYLSVYWQFRSIPPPR